MIESKRTAGPAVAGRRGSLLFVATLAHTVHHFLIPYAEHFRALGWRVDAAANGVSGDVALQTAFDRVFELPLSRSILDVPGLVRGERAISGVLASEPDIVHVHTPIASFITRLAVHRMPPYGRPTIIYTAHGFHFYHSGNPMTNGMFMLAERLAGRWTDRLIVINDEDYEAAQKLRIVPPRHLVRMPGIGVDTEAYARSSMKADDFSRARAQLQLQPATPLFVVVGELNRNKRHVDVIRAITLMRHTDAQLVLVGDGRERAHLEALTSRRGVRDRVQFAGHVDDIRPLVGSSTALILASKREGLARSIMEALALEVPVIASTARGNRELVQPDSGFVFPTGDASALAANMDWLIDHPLERLEMGRRGRAQMVERYDLRNVVRMHEEMYLGILAERG